MITSHLCRKGLITVPFLASLAPLSVTYSADQTHSFNLPPFTTSDHFTFNLSDTIRVPQFDTVGGALVLRQVLFDIDYGEGSTAQYDVTNIGNASGFGALRATHGVTAFVPSGLIFGPPFGSNAGGPVVAQGQSAIVAAPIGTAQSHGFGFGSSEAFAGNGSVALNISIEEVVTVMNPASFTATYHSGDAASGTLVVTYRYGCVGDATLNGTIDVDDLLLVISSWGVIGSCMPNPPCGPDVDPPAFGNAIVNVDDLLSVISHWGPCPQPASR